MISFDIIIIIEITGNRKGLRLFYFCSVLTDFIKILEGEKQYAQ